MRERSRKDKKAKLERVSKRLAYLEKKAELHIKQIDNMKAEVDKLLKTAERLENELKK